MSILAAAIMPHPPLLIPSVGHGEEETIYATREACRKAADFLLEQKPDVILVTSPHTTLYGDFFHISPGLWAEGSFAAFGAPQEKMVCRYDDELAETVEKLAAEEQFPAGTMGQKDPSLDHATMVPLSFFGDALKDVKIVRIGLSGLSLKDHYHLGQLLAKAVEKLGRRAVFLASGDLSHKLKKDGPYGFAPEGPEYDCKLMDAMKKADFGALFGFPELLLDEAAECGHRSFTIMAGAFDGKDVKAGNLSYEGPFGVGYGVATFLPEGDNPERRFAEKYDDIRKEMRDRQRAEEDIYVQVARAIVERFVRLGTMPIIPKELKEKMPREMTAKKAGAFVTLHKNGSLRGCIGTMGPVQDSIAEEIRHNAVSACSRDPRFTPVTPDELEDLVYSVDVLGELEQITSIDQLDPHEYGVLVSKGSRSGVLLPNLPGIDTVEQQLEIACQKGGIRPEEGDLFVQRFRVVRHT